MNESSSVFEVIDKTVKASNNRLSVKELCKTAGVSRSGYYAWIKAAPVREAAEEQVKELQREVQYLRQEVEFLKKISSIRTTGK